MDVTDNETFSTDDTANVEDATGGDAEMQTADGFEDFDVDEPENLQALDVDESEAVEDQEPEGDDEPVEALVDIEIDGATYKVPEAIKDKFMLQQDYTRKTQETAEIRRAFEQKMEAAEQAYQISQEEMQLSAYMMNLQNRIQELSQMDWQALENEDPMSAGSKTREYVQLVEQAKQAQAHQQQLQTQRQQQMESLTAERLQETAEYARKELPNWSPELDAEITGFAVQELGFDVDTLKSAYNPQVYKALYLAHIGQKALARSQSPKPTVQPEKKAKPLSKVTGRGNVQSGPVEAIDDMEKYAKLRKQQMGVPN